MEDGAWQMATGPSTGRKKGLYSQNKIPKGQDKIPKGGFSESKPSYNRNT